MLLYGNIKIPTKPPLLLTSTITIAGI